MTRSMTTANGLEEDPLPTTLAVDGEHLNYPAGRRQIVPTSQDFNTEDRTETPTEENNHG